MALWHDISWQLVAWGWLLVVFLGLETLFSRLSLTPPGKQFALNYPIFKERLEILGAALMIFMLKLACLIGYGYDIDGASRVVDSLASVQGLSAMVVYTVWMYSLVRVLRWIERKQALTLSGGEGEKIL